MTKQYQNMFAGHDRRKVIVPSTTVLIPIRNAICMKNPQKISLTLQKDLKMRVNLALGSILMSKTDRK